MSDVRNRRRRATDIAHLRTKPHTRRVMSTRQQKSQERLSRIAARGCWAIVGLYMACWFGANGPMDAWYGVPTLVIAILHCSAWTAATISEIIKK